MIDAIFPTFHQEKDQIDTFSPIEYAVDDTLSKIFDMMEWRDVETNIALVNKRIYLIITNKIQSISNRILLSINENNVIDDGFYFHKKSTSENIIDQFSRMTTSDIRKILQNIGGDQPWDKVHQNFGSTHSVLNRVHRASGLIISFQDAIEQQTGERDAINTLIVNGLGKIILSRMNTISQTETASFNEIFLFAVYRLIEAGDTSTAISITDKLRSVNTRDMSNDCIFKKLLYNKKYHEALEINKKIFKPSSALLNFMLIIFETANRDSSEICFSAIRHISHQKDLKDHILHKVTVAFAESGSEENAWRAIALIQNPAMKDQATASFAEFSVSDTEKCLSIISEICSQNVRDTTLASLARNIMNKEISGVIETIRADDVLTMMSDETMISDILASAAKDIAQAGKIELARNLIDKSSSVECKKHIAAKVAHMFAKHGEQQDVSYILSHFDNGKKKDKVLATICGGLAEKGIPITEIESYVSSIENNVYAEIAYANMAIGFARDHIDWSTASRRMISLREILDYTLSQIAIEQARQIITLKIAFEEITDGLVRIANKIRNQTMKDAAFSAISIEFGTSGDQANFTKLSAYVSDKKYLEETIKNLFFYGIAPEMPVGTSLKHMLNPPLHPLELGKDNNQRALMLLNLFNIWK